MGATAEPPPRRIAAARHEQLRRWIFGEGEARRFTQDSAVLPQVWLDYDAAPEEAHDLLLTPHAHSSAAELAQALDARLGRRGRRMAGLAYNEGYVVVRLSLRELVRVVLPLAVWWHELERPPAPDLGEWVREHAELLATWTGSRGVDPRGDGSYAELAWFVGLLGRTAHPYPSPTAAEIEDREAIVATAAELLEGVPGTDADEPPLLWTVNQNRRARTTVHRSRETVKADAATLLFDVSCATIRWAVVDVGIDAKHPAFRRRTPDSLRPDPLPEGCNALPPTRVQRTYDFTRLRGLLSGELRVELPHTAGAQRLDAARRAHDALETLAERLRSGRAIDWDSLDPLLRVWHDDRPAEEGGYVAPVGEHGTHVAGILAADWRTDDEQPPPKSYDIRGVCPDIELYDLRVFDSAEGGDEFPITAALQFVRYLNAHSDLPVIHGANLSLAIAHDVKNYACGCTPICDECERLVASGVVVVASAGNDGRTQYTDESGSTDGYRTVSIVDPGNAERVLTVGSTHRYQPHTYGVSYFSSRGPTGDGRRKPDLVAPGERIEAPVPGADAKFKDGTSQAAPHVSGAAALLMARYEELRGNPDRIKALLCSTATDLGRERYFQGAGMVDVLRAMQEV